VKPVRITAGSHTGYLNPPSAVLAFAAVLLLLGVVSLCCGWVNGFSPLFCLAAEGQI